jgi:hypothetical protein
LAWLQEELSSEQRLRELMIEEERAIRAADMNALTAAAQRIEEETKGGSARERRRAELLRAFGRVFGCDPRALSLTSIAERLGRESHEAERVLSLRGELRALVADVARRSRRIAGLARYHEGLFLELMGTLLGAQPGTGTAEGVLVDAEA